MKSEMFRKRSRCVQIILLIVTAVLMLMIFPLRFVGETTEAAAGGDVAYAVSDRLENGVICTQKFVMQQDYCKSISVALAVDDNRKKDGSIQFSLYNKNKCILQKMIPLSNFSDAEYYEISVGKWIKKDSVYYFTISAQNCADNIPAIYITQIPSQNTPGNLSLTIGKKTENGQAVDRIRYEKSLNLYNTLMLWSFLILLNLVLAEWIDRQIKGEDQSDGKGIS